MMTCRVRAAGDTLNAVQDAQHLMTQTLPPELSESIADLTATGGPGTPEQTVPQLRAGTPVYVTNRLGIDTTRDMTEAELLARIGSAENSAKEVLQVLYPDLAAHQDEIDGTRPFAGVEADADFKRAPCCRPLPGERIVGITYRGKGVVIHAIDCPVLAEYEDSPDRWVDVQWRAGRHPAVYSTVLHLTIRHDAGVLGRICSLIGAQGANISNLEFLDRKPDFYRIEVEVELRDQEHLHNLLTALEAESDVAQVARIRDIAKKP